MILAGVLSGVLLLPSVVSDRKLNLLAQAHRITGALREYEFVMPLMNVSDGNTAWERGRAHQIAILLGAGEEYRGITEKTWMSDQIVLRIGGPSTTSIYLHPLSSPDDSGRRH
jgi:hypothetical protein